MSCADLIVVSPYQHLIFRGVAAFIFAPFLIYCGLIMRGIKSHNLSIYGSIIIFIGIITFIIDAYTFYHTLNVYN